MTHGRVQAHILGKDEVVHGSMVGRLVPSSEHRTSVNTDCGSECSLFTVAINNDDAMTVLWESRVRPQLFMRYRVCPNADGPTYVEVLPSPGASCGPCAKSP
jgi:hypothetical protein